MKSQNSIPAPNCACGNPSFCRMFEGPVDLQTALELVGEGPPVYKWTGFSDKNEVSFR